MLQPVLPDRILHDRGIERLMEEGVLSIEPDLLPGSLQSATIDVHIGKLQLYNAQARAVGVAKYMKKVRELELAGDFAELLETDPFVEPQVYISGKAIIASNAFVELFTRERFAFSKNGYSLSLELRSSRGRLHLDDLALYSDTSGCLQINAVNYNPNALALNIGSKFAQVFVHVDDPSLPFDGYAVTDAAEVKSLLPGLEVLSSGHVVFRLGEKALVYDRRESVVDPSQKESSLYREVSLRDGYLLNRSEPLIIQLEPALSLPDTMGILLLKRPPFQQSYGKTGPVFVPGMTDHNQVCAGWVDPGFSGPNKTAATITAHPYRLGIPEVLRCGQPFAYGIVYHFKTPVKRPYGSEELGSHYHTTNGLSGSRS